jgi:diguanylate cyclase (GGDEF)-like protein
LRLAVERLSIRGLILLCLLVLFVTTLLVVYQSETNYRAASREQEEDVLRRIMSVAVRQVYEEVHIKTRELGRHLIQRPAFREAFTQASSKGLLGRKPGEQRSELETILLDPFINGHINSVSVSLEAFRVFDSDWRLLATGRTASLMNVDGFDLDPGPSPVARRAMQRHGAERLQALGDRWAGSRDAYYSVVLPIGGLRLQGYLEVIVNAAINLPRVEGLVEMPLAIVNRINQRRVHDNAPPQDRLPRFHQIHYDILAPDEQPLYRISMFTDVAGFDAHMERQQTRSMLISILISLAVLILVLWFLERLLVAPMRRLRNQIHAQIRLFTGESVSTWGLLEFHDLARDFNHLLDMAWQQQLVLEKRSATDELTQVPNRRALDQFLQAEKSRASRCNDKLALLMVDIDYFKNYNDHYGHQRGDDCLRDVAQALQSALPRVTDFVARYGGEEFMVVLPGTDQQGAQEVAERLLEQIRQLRIPHQASAVADCVTLSLGVAVCQTFEPGCIEQLKYRADQALYQAKHQGRNRVCVYPEDEGRGSGQGMG